MSKNQIGRYIMVISLFLSTYQGALLASETMTDSIKMQSAVIMFIAIILTAVKNYLSVEINDKKANTIALCLMAAAILGGLADLMDKVPAFVSKQGARIVVTSLSTTLAMLGKELFPSYEAKKINAERRELEK